jgi:GntR family transcriptional regulator
MAGPQPLDSTDRRPLWEQVLADLERRLAEGEFRERFPTDLDLMDDYEVSRHTVREAVRRIEATGLLVRQRGRGSFVRREVFEQPLGSLYSLFRSLEERGHDQTSVTRRLEVRRETAPATRLGLPDDAELVFLERVRLVDGQPLALDRVWLPAGVGAGLLEVDFSHTALYDELARTAGVRPVRGSELIRPVVPTASERRILDVDETTAAFLIERYTESTTGPVEWRESLVRGDRYGFRQSWNGPVETDEPGLEPA